MDLKRALEFEHSKKQCLKTVDYVGNNTSRFKVLVELFLAGPYRLTQRAAWPLSVCVERHPALILPYLNSILSFAAKPGSHDSVRRNTMRLLQFTQVPKRYQGKVLDLAFELFQNRKEAIAIRVFAMTVIEKLVQDKPELQRELVVLLEDEVPYASAAFRSRASKILKKWSKLR
jgi:hypothetical protein